MPPTGSDTRGRAGEHHVRQGEPLRALSDAVYTDHGFDAESVVRWRDLYRIVTRVGGIPLQTLADLLSDADVDPDAEVTWGELLAVLGQAEKPYQSGKGNG